MQVSKIKYNPSNQDIWGGHAHVDACFNLKQSKVSISLFFFFFSWVYMVVESYVKLIIVSPSHW
jgi:hypothetical protein